MNSRQSELRKTELESKEIQYQMQYFPMHYNVQGVNDGQKSMVLHASMMPFLFFVFFYKKSMDL